MSQVTDTEPPEAAGSPLPASLAPFFQEYRFASLDPDVHAELVIERVLAFGNREEVRWLLKRYGRDRVRTWLAGPGARRLPRRRYGLWAVLLEGAENSPARQSDAVAWPH